MSVIKHKFSNEKISLLKHFLVNNAKDGRHSDYEIYVDEMKVVTRTNDIEQFDNYEEFVNGDTREVIIVRYDGSSRRNDRHILSFKEETKPEANPLSGINIDRMVDEKLKQAQKQWEHEQLEKENNELKEKLSEAEEYIGKQATAIEDLKSKRKMEDMQWGEIAGVAVESIFRNNTHLIAKVPGMAGLAGIIERDNKIPKHPNATSTPETEASFSKQEPTENPKENAEEKEHLEILKQLQDRFSNENLTKIMNLLQILLQNPKAIEPTHVFATQWRETENSKTNSNEKK